MGAWIERLLQTLVGTLWSLLAAQVTARVELELAATRAELLERAADWRQRGQIGEAIARRLEAASENLIVVPPQNIGGYLPESGAETNGKLRPRIKSEQRTLVGGETQTKRPRGRPKKAADAAKTTLGLTAESPKPEESNPETPS
jgi:hypothetical protein